MYGQRWRTLKDLVRIGLIALSLWTLPAHAQLQVSDSLKMNVSGVLGTGYGGEFGEGLASNDHNSFVQGQATLSGSYYDPRFLSFTVQPFYNRNQENSSFGSVLNESGISSSVNLFGGSHFPGSVSYSRLWTNGNQYGLGSGAPTVIADGANQSFDITWNALFPKWPTLTATWSDNSSSDEILGESDTVHSKIRSLNLLSSYSLRGFNLFGTFSHQAFEASFPTFISGLKSESQSSSDNFSVSVNHSLPLNGTVGAIYQRTSYDGSSASVLNSGSSDTWSGNVAVSPTHKFSIGGSARYYTNLVGGVQNGLLPAGAVPLIQYSAGTDGLGLNAFGSYAIGHGFSVVGYANHGVQHFQGQVLSNSQYGGTLTYSYGRPLLGLLYFSVGLVNTADNNNQGGVALVGNLGLKKQLGRWDINTDGSYSQNVQNTIAWYTTSNYNYGGFVRRRFGDWIYWSVSARDARSGLTQIGGFNNRSETYMTSLTRRSIGISASYSQSVGTSILTSSGALVPLPVTPILLPGELIFNGTSYGGTLSLAPTRRMTINTSWYRVNSDTTSIPPITLSGLQPAPVFSINSSNRVYAVMNYNLRKLNFQARYWRVGQLISAAELPQAIQNNYSFTVSRWFKF